MDPKAAKKQRLAEAKARMAEKRKAAKKERLQERHGVSTEQERRALVTGFKTEEGKADATAYNRHIRAQSARKYTEVNGKRQFVKADGEVDMPEYERYMKKQTARNFKDEAGNYPFRNADGSGNVAAYKRYMNEKSARNYEDVAGNHSFVKADGGVDMTAYEQHIAERTARNFKDEAGNHPFRNADGSGNVTAYKRHMWKQQARNYEDEAGNHPFVKANGEVDMLAYYQHAAEQTARNFKDEAGNYPFRNADGSGNVAAYKRHIRKQRARNYEDKAGNHPFVKANGEVDMLAYNRYLAEQTARNFKDEAGNYPFRHADGSGNVMAYYQHMVNQKAWSYIKAAANHALPFQRTSGAKNQIPLEDVQVIGAYMLIAQLDGSHKKRSAKSVAIDAWNLMHLVTWLRQSANVPQGLNSLEKLGRHRRDEEVEYVLARFRKAPKTPANVKGQIKGIVEVLRWIWHRMEDLLEKERQAVVDREAARFAADLEAELSFSEDTPSNVSEAGAALFEAAGRQPPQPGPEVADRQADIISGHLAQTGEVDADVIEYPADFSEPEWDIPFDPLEMGVLFQDLDDMQIDEDFFEFILDEEMDDGLDSH